MAAKIREIGAAFSHAMPLTQVPRHTALPQAIEESPTARMMPAAPPLSQATHPAPPWLGSPATTPSDEGLTDCAAQIPRALVGNLSIECRRYEDLRRARQRLLLQAMAMCRYSCDGDREAGAKLYAQIVKEPGHPLAVWLIPYFEAMKPLDAAIKEQEKTVAKLARQLPVWPWAREIGGLSDRFLGLVVGECGTGPGEYRNPSCLWKRMGMAVIDGGRQRRVTGEAAIEHGYVARRRSLMWNIGESMIKAQVRKGEDDSRYGKGFYGQLYLDRKAYELTKTDKPIIAHNRAKRYMEKRLLRELWKTWRRECPEAVGALAGFHFDAARSFLDKLDGADGR